MANLCIKLNNFSSPYRINAHLRLKDSNVTCVFVPTGFPQNRSRFYQKVSDRDNENDDEEDREGESDNDEEWEEKPIAKLF